MLIDGGMVLVWKYFRERGGHDGGQPRAPVADGAAEVGEDTARTGPAARRLAVLPVPDRETEVAAVGGDAVLDGADGVSIDHLFESEETTAPEEPAEETPATAGNEPGTVRRLIWSLEHVWEDTEAPAGRRSRRRGTALAW